MSDQSAYTNIANELSKVIENGTEAEARQFIMDHFKELPEELQRSLALDVFEEALEEEVTKQDMVIELRKEASDVINKLGENGTHE